MKVLILCHGKNHTFGSCTTSGLEFTRCDYCNWRTLDIDKEANPDICHNMKDKYNNDIENNMYNIVTTMCCYYDVFIDSKTGQLQDNSFKNILYFLKSDGYFLMSIPKYGYKRYLQRLNNNKYKKIYNQYWLSDNIYNNKIRKIEKWIQYKIMKEIIYKYPELSIVFKREKDDMLKIWNKTETINDKWNSIIMFKRNNY